MPLELVSVTPRWHGRTVVVAAPGPSLTPEVAARCVAWPAVAVQDAWRLLPWADIIYGCDADWWLVHDGCRAFAGERWSAHAPYSDKTEVAQAFGIRCVAGCHGTGFSTDPAVLHWGGNSGFQAVNLAILAGAARVVLVGFDMRAVDGPDGPRRHFFGDHPAPLRNEDDWPRFAAAFAAAAKHLPPGVAIVNATPGSALTGFPTMGLEEALDGTSEEAAA